jgi:hypothetical protein
VDHRPAGLQVAIPAAACPVREVGARGGEEFRILGPFEIVGPAGPADLRGAKRRGLLACLVVNAGQPMSSDQLVDELWGDAGSDDAARTVQTYVSQLRNLLRGEAASLQTRPGGYVLEVDPAAVDAFRFEQGLTAASTETDPTRSRRTACRTGRPRPGTSAGGGPPSPSPPGTSDGACPGARCPAPAAAATPAGEPPRA